MGQERNRTVKFLYIVKGQTKPEKQAYYRYITKVFVHPCPKYFLRTKRCDKEDPPCLGGSKGKGTEQKESHDNASNITYLPRQYNHKLHGRLDRNKKRKMEYITRESDGGA